MKKIQQITLGTLMATPFLASAQLGDVQTLLVRIGVLIKIAIPIAGGLALLYFVYGLATFILHSGDQKSHEEGKNRMVWGVVALFVLITVWGLVSFLQRNLNIFPTNGPQQIPTTTIPDGQNPPVTI